MMSQRRQTVESTVCEGDISGTSSRKFRFGTNIHLDSKVKSLDFGSQRLKVKLTVAS